MRQRLALINLVGAFTSGDANWILIAHKIDCMEGQELRYAVELLNGMLGTE